MLTKPEDSVNLPTPFYEDIYRHEFYQLSAINRRRSLSLWVLYCKMISENHNTEETWADLNNGYTDSFLALFQEIKQKDLKNLRSFWGRRYNMMYNIPSSYEVYRGRIYSVGL